MKFSHSIKLNSAPEWQDQYIDYKDLKKFIYELEGRVLGTRLPVTQEHGRGNEGGDMSSTDDDDLVSENTPLLAGAGAGGSGRIGGGGAAMDSQQQHQQRQQRQHERERPMSVAEANSAFRLRLDLELAKINEFYAAQLSELRSGADAIAREIRAVELSKDGEFPQQISGSPSRMLTGLSLASPMLNPAGQSSGSTSQGAPASQPGGPSASPSAAIQPSPASSASNNSQGGSNQSPSAHPAGALLPIVASSEAAADAAHEIQSLAGVLTEPGSVLITLSTDTHNLHRYLLMWSSSSDKKDKIRKRVTALFVAFSRFQTFVEINRTGFSKILKKYEKVIGTHNIKAEYMARVEHSLTFTANSARIVSAFINAIITVFARIATNGFVGPAKEELNDHLTDQIEWERNTIWRDMVEHERRNESIIGSRAGHVAGSQGAPTYFRWVDVCGFSVPRPIISSSVLSIIFAFIVLIVVVKSEILPTPEQTNCLAILLFASILWALEALPLFITSILVPLLVVILKVQRKNGERLGAKDAAKQIFSDMFGPVIMLLLGGFSLAGALSKHNIAKEAAAVILARAGSNPKWVLLANMFVSTFASMWISNVAAPVLCFSLVTSILRNLPRGSPYARCLVLGIAMAANVGGMASPIASPQNIIAMANMNPPPSWPQWFAIAIPICIVVDACIWGLLIVVFNPKEETSPPELFRHDFSFRKFTGKQIYVLLVTVVTIGLWCVESSIEGIVGDMGVIAIVPIVAFYGAGILTKDDWNSMLWSVVMLAMGGVALGKAVDSSGLLAFMTSKLSPFLQELSLPYCLALLTAVVVVVTSFISHTVGALIILPVVAQLGASLPDPRPRTLVMASALLCSGGMALPVSSFPNMNAISLEDHTGKPWLNVADFLRIGVISTIVAWIAVMAVGVPVMSLLEFN
eukprot:jgi/Hompol1/2933/HPOL_003058-RA